LVGGLGGVVGSDSPWVCQSRNVKVVFFWSQSLVGGSVGSERGSWWVVACFENEIRITFGGLKWAIKLVSCLVRWMFVHIRGS
jgi:hypothetical protein